MSTTERAAPGHGVGPAGTDRTDDRRRGREPSGETTAEAGAETPGEATRETTGERGTGMTATPLTTGDPDTAWGELVTAALLGSERRTPPGGSPAALLDAAAVATVRH
ncbi:hypothetical protein AN218_29550, partial [Streptomyces nanshensis]